MGKKLFELQPGTRLKLNITREESEMGKKETTEMATFDHIDGMYSHITLDSGGAVHLAAFTPMMRVDDYWEIDEK